MWRRPSLVITILQRVWLQPFNPLLGQLVHIHTFSHGYTLSVKLTHPLYRQSHTHYFHSHWHTSLHPPSNIEIWLRFVTKPRIFWINILWTDKTTVERFGRHAQWHVWYKPSRRKPMSPQDPPPRLVLQTQGLRALGQWWTPLRITIFLRESCNRTIILIKPDYWYLND